MVSASRLTEYGMKYPGLTCSSQPGSVAVRKTFDGARSFGSKLA